jgi:dimethylhistidine N-methyltransferase
MKPIQAREITLLGSEPRANDLRAEVLDGLAGTPKTLPCKLFYDAAGSRLFERICEQDEYYPTRTELAIMRAHAGEIVAALGRGCRLVELGSGSSLKTRILLDHLPDIAAYLPIDISRTQLLAATRALAAAYPHVPIEPVCADYSRAMPPLPHRGDAARTVVYFPGSTIGNFTAHEATAFLRRIGQMCGARGALLIGVDLEKDAGILHRAYNDAAGVTARFNLNVLTRINRELGGDFALARFRHRAFWDAGPGRIEMQLVSREAHTVRVAGREFALGEGEAITTEYSHKYTLAGFAAIARVAGFAVQRVWTDREQMFSVQYCERIREGLAAV